MRIWLSFDIEATGPSPGLHSMISFGAVALLDSAGGKPEEVESFESNLRPLDDTVWDPDTRRWWSTWPAELIRATEDPEEPADAMVHLVTWLRDLRRDWPDASHVWVARPISFDMPFLSYYMNRFRQADWNAMYEYERFSGLDITSYASAILGRWPVSKDDMPDRWLPEPNKQPHVAIEDARWQGRLFANMLHDHRTNGVKLGGPHE